MLIHITLISQCATFTTSFPVRPTEENRPDERQSNVGQLNVLGASSRDVWLNYNEWKRQNSNTMEVPGLSWKISN